MGARARLVTTLAFAGLSGCSGLLAGPPMPPPTGAQEVIDVAGTEYIVTRSAVASMPGGELMRVYRAHGAGFDYSEGQTAKDVVVAFCKSHHRGLSPWAMGMYEPTGAWAFPGGCAT